MVAGRTRLGIAGRGSGAFSPECRQRPARFDPLHPVHGVGNAALYMYRLADRARIGATGAIIARLARALPGI